MFAPVGRIRLVALWVRISASAKIRQRSAPETTVPNAVMVVVPVMLTTMPVASARLVVAAEAMLLEVGEKLSAADIAVAALVPPAVMGRGSLASSTRSLTKALYFADSIVVLAVAKVPAGASY